MLSAAVELGVFSAGLFLLIGMLTGVWKFLHVRRPPLHRAPIYVDIAHRASLMYSPACLVLAALAWRSAWPDGVDLAAVAVAIFYFATAVGAYVVHGLRRTEGTQYRERNFTTTWGTWTLIVGEAGAVVVLLAGVVAGWFGLA